ncbi:MAG: DUF45 domain-containing protein [Bacilli bacterium]|nr:DUF45 domain-containing protein [Bacilli bacterium]
MKINIDGIFFDVIITRKRIKNIYFRIKEDLNIYVSCNNLYTNKYIEDLLLKNKKDILKMYNNMRLKTNDKKEIYYLGDKLEFIESKKIKIDTEYAYGPNIESINEYLEKNSLKFFETRLNRLMIQFNDLPKFRLRTRRMKTRWGVCNKSSMTVTLNTELIHKDVTLIDYVIIHELCHFKHMNHSELFWREVERYYPYYKLARKRLK